MSKKSRERREKHKYSKPDDYYFDGVFEMARFGKNTIFRNNCTPGQQEEQMRYLCEEYPKKYKELSQRILSLKEKIVKCDPYELLMYLHTIGLTSQINIFSEIELSGDATSCMRAQEYVQSVIISSECKCDLNQSNQEKEKTYAEIFSDFDAIYKELLLFYVFWASHIQETSSINGKQLDELVEAQYMYWVRGNRYQVFELEPLKALLPPHDSILVELFGVSASDIINGLEKLRYSLSQGYADAMMDLGKAYDEFVEAMDSGKELSQVIEENDVRTSGIVGKVFGSDLIEVKQVTGWDDRFIDLLSAEVNEINDFWGTEDFSGWPIVALPVARKPFIKIDGTSYAFLYYALFDNIYRNIQKGIYKYRPDYLNQWKNKQTEASESMVRDLFLKLLPGAEAHVSNYYPVNKSLKQMNENDIVIIYHNNLFVIEVKAGSFPTTPPITDFEAYIRSYQKLAEEADSQCSRTVKYIKEHECAQFYNRDKQPTFQLPSLSTFENIFTFSVTVDNFNEFAAKAEKSSVISLKEETIIISYDDLLSYAEYFESATVFLHYLKQRKAAMRVPQYQMQDELDHLGLYIDRNLYALNPDQYGDVKRVFWNGFREPLDKYFSRLFVDPSKAQRPQQAIPEEVNKIIDWLDRNVSSEGINFAHYLLDLTAETKKDFSEQIKHALRRQREIGRMTPMIAFGDCKYCTFVSMPGAIPFPEDKQYDYVYAAASRNESIPVMWIFLEYDEKHELTKVASKLCSFAELTDEEAVRLKAYGEEKAEDWLELYKLTHGKAPGRNDPCSCGSGKKYKFCCLDKQ